MPHGAPCAILRRNIVPNNPSSRLLQTPIVVGRVLWEGLNKIGTNVALWFLPALFCGRLMMEAVLRVVNRIGLPTLPCVLAAAALSFVVGWNLPRPEMGYPLGLNSGFIALGFMLIGSASRDLLAAVDRLGRRAAAEPTPLFATFCSGRAPTESSRPKSPTD